MKLLSTALLIVFPSLIFAQSNYHPGSVLKNNGDTLKGYINYREWDYSPQTIEFKQSKADTGVLIFNPQLIKRFQVTGMENYISYVGLASANKNEFPNIPVGLDTTTVKAAIFLKPLVTGKYISLFYNNELYKNRFFIAEKDQLPVELKYYEYYDNTRTHEVFHNLYRGQLLLYVNKFNSGDQKLIRDIEDVRFEQQDLESIVDKINNVNFKSKGRDTINYNKATSNIRVFGGVGINSVATTYNGLYRSNTLGTKVDLGIDIFANPNIQQFVFRIELSYNSLSGSFNSPATGTNNTSDNLSFTQSSFALTPQILYNIYNKDKFKVYIDGGFAFYKFSYSNNGNDIPNQSRPFWAYIPLQAGLVFNKRIEVSFTISSFNTAAYYSTVEVVSKISKTLGLKVFFN
ncbi:MAG: hypothetical protein JWP45_1188 [Mucilaginibacter sp.]|nr:hypothetical protein [Mucilaginibacter sp.]